MVRHWGDCASTARQDLEFDPFTGLDGALAVQPPLLLA